MVLSEHPVEGLCGSAERDFTTDSRHISLDILLSRTDSCSHRAADQCDQPDETTTQWICPTQIHASLDLQKLEQAAAQTAYTVLMLMPMCDYSKDHCTHCWHYRTLPSYFEPSCSGKAGHCLSHAILLHCADMNQPANASAVVAALPKDVHRPRITCPLIPSWRRRHRLPNVALQQAAAEIWHLQIVLIFQQHEVLLLEDVLKPAMQHVVSPVIAKHTLDSTSRLHVSAGLVLLNARHARSTCANVDMQQSSKSRQCQSWVPVCRHRPEGGHPAGTHSSPGAIEGPRGMLLPPAKRIDALAAIKDHVTHIAALPLQKCCSMPIKGPALRNSV